MDEHRAEDFEVPVINLADAPGERAAWGRPAPVVFAWGLVEWLLVSNPLQISSKVRVAALRAFGAKIGDGVVFRPRTRVKFPWKLAIGDRCWIGEGVWIHNQDIVTIGSDVAISQEAFITTGSHAHRTDMSLITSPVRIDDGAWLSSRAMVLGGSHVGRSTLIGPNVVVGPAEDVSPNSILRAAAARMVGRRFRDNRSNASHD